MCNGVICFIEAKCVGGKGQATKRKWFKVVRLNTVVAKRLRPKSIFVCEATCPAVLHQKSFAIASSFLVSESVTQETVSSHKHSAIQQ